jgi:NAD-dependent deacetylase
MSIPPTPALVILTGAGISAESGLATFRGSGGMWEQHPVEEVATPEGFRANPELVHRFYNERRSQLQTVQPNAAHLALAELEKGWAGDFLLVTQNVDDLHDRAGSQNLLHMHGELNKIRCTLCHRVSLWEDAADTHTPCPACGQPGGLRPDIVWFGEFPQHMERITLALESCDLFVAIGTSGQVYPAANFVQWVRRGARTVEINLEVGASASRFQEVLTGKATERVPELVKALLG